MDDHDKGNPDRRTGLIPFSGYRWPKLGRLWSHSPGMYY